jgi:hypothetical protein
MVGARGKMSTMMRGFARGKVEVVKFFEKLVRFIPLGGVEFEPNQTAEVQGRNRGPGSFSEDGEIWYADVFTALDLAGVNQRPSLFN